MSFSEKTIRTLEFDKVCAMLADCAETEGACAMAQNLRPSADRVTVRRRLDRTTDARRLADAMRDLLDIASVLRTARTLTDYSTGNHPFDTVLDEVFARLLPDRRLEERITHAILSEDMMADEASPTLADIRRKIRNENARIREVLQKMISGSPKYLQENIVTMRGGRYVIPVKAECKNEVKGLIHDTSSTGATIFVEPMAVVDANNEIRLLQTREEREVSASLPSCRRWSAIRRMRSG